MKKLIAILAIILFAGNIFAQDIRHMERNKKNISVKNLSLPLTIEDDESVLVEFKLEFAADYFAPNAKMTIIPTLTGSAGTMEMAPKVVVGDKRNDGEVISHNKITIKTYSDQFFFPEEGDYTKLTLHASLTDGKNNNYEFDFFTTNLSYKNKSNAVVIDNNLGDDVDSDEKSDEKDDENNLVSPNQNLIPDDIYVQNKIDSLTTIVEQAKQKGDTKLEAATLSQIAILNFQRQELGLAYENFRQAIELKESQADTSGLSDLYSNLAAISESRNDPELAIMFIDKGLEVNKTQGNQKALAKLNAQKSKILYNNNNPEQAIEALEQTIQIEETLNSKEELLASYNNLAVLYAAKNDYENSEKYLKRAEELNKNDKKIQAMVQNNAGNNYFYQGKYKEAIQSYEKSFKLKEENADTAGMSLTMFNIANTYKTQEEIDKAIASYQQSLEYAEKAYLQDLIEKNNYMLGKLSSLQEECSASVSYLNNYISSRFAYLDEIDKQIPDIAPKYNENLDKQQLLAKIDILQNEKNLYRSMTKTQRELIIEKDKNAKIQNRMIYGLSGALLIVLLFAILFMREYILKRRANIKLNENLEIIKQQNEEISSQSEQLKQANEEIRTINEGLEEQKNELQTTLENLRKTQSQLVESEKMASLGQLIAGIAHELNTPLGAINSSIKNVDESMARSLAKLPELLKKIDAEELVATTALIDASLSNTNHYTSRELRKYKRETRKNLEEKGYENASEIADILTEMEILEDYEKFEKIFKSEHSTEIFDVAYNLSIQKKNSENITIAIGRASKIISALRNYSHKYDHSEMAEADITKGIETILTLYHNKTKHSIKINKNYQQIDNIKCFADELNQVWTNILHNSIQAIEGKGEITIDINQNDEFVTVKIADTGKGIPQEIQEKVFKPFFTTKKSGEGTGLGLDITKKIVEKHNGQISFESTEGKGTTFIVKLPKRESGQ